MFTRTRIYIGVGILALVLTMGVSIKYLHGRLVDVETENKTLNDKVVQIDTRVTEQTIAVQKVRVEKSAAYSRYTEAVRELEIARGNESDEEALNTWFNQTTARISCVTGDLTKCVP